MAIVKPSQLSINIATMLIKEIDPDGKLGLEPTLDMETFQEMKDGELVISEDIFEEFPGAAAFLLVRDSLGKMVVTDPNGDITPTLENSFWVDKSGNFRDAAFSVIMSRFQKLYQDDSYIGASFRLRNGKIAATLRPADDLERAKLQLVKAIMKKGKPQSRNGTKEMLELLGALGD